MSKLPKYMSLHLNEKKLTFTLKVKKWGIPLLVFKTMKENFNIPWYMWVAYPYMVIKVMKGLGDSYE